MMVPLPKTGEEPKKIDRFQVDLSELRELPGSLLGAWFMN